MIGRERPHHAPFPIDVYRKESDDADIHLIRALRIAGDNVDQAVLDEHLPLHLYESASVAALSLTTAQCLENHKQGGPHHVEVPEVAEDPIWELAMDSQATPGELVGLLARHPGLRGIELARLTHIGRWLGRSALQAPVLHSIEEIPGLETQLLVDVDDDNDDVAGADAATPSHYELWFDDPSLVVIARKRVLAEHRGPVLGKVALLRSIESLSLMADRNALPFEVSDALTRAVDINSGRIKKEDNPEGIHPSAILREHIQPFFEMPASKRPAGLLPHMTTYFATSEVPRYLRTDEPR